MPSVQKAHREYPAKDVVVMTVSLDGGDGTAVKKFLDEHKYTMPSAHDKGMAFGRAIKAREQFVRTGEQIEVSHQRSDGGDGGCKRVRMKDQMRVLGEIPLRRRAHPLRRRIERAKLEVLILEILELAIHAIVLEIGDLGAIEHIVLVRRTLERTPKLRSASCLPADAVPMTVARRSRASCVAAMPRPPPALCTSTVSPDVSAAIR